jgi:hypothetical protein
VTTWWSTFYIRVTVLVRLQRYEIFSDLAIIIIDNNNFNGELYELRE